MQQVSLSTAGWTATGYLGRTFADRLLGVWRVPEGSTVVLPVSSVHSFGRRRPLVVVGLDAERLVVSVQTLEPNHIVVMPGARFLIESPVGGALPALGDRVEIGDV